MTESQKNTLRLALSYLAIIMVMSLTFSLILFRISSRQVERGLERPPSPLFIIRPDLESIWTEFRAERLESARQYLIRNTLLLNLGVLLAGGAFSYFLARRTLEPIEATVERERQFTADASHELRTPLSAMQTEIEVALRDSKLDIKDARALLKSNLEEVAKLKALSGGLLKLARNGSAPILQAVHLLPVITEATGQIKSAAKAKEMTIKTNVSEITVRAEPESLRELLVILLDNAVKYSPANSTIMITAKKVSQLAELTVKDQGIGIAADDLPHIFDRFFRADSARSTGGYGLGLAIAKQLASHLDGTITAESTLGKGSVFTVKLPLS